MLTAIDAQSLRIVDYVAMSERASATMVDPILNTTRVGT